MRKFNIVLTTLLLYAQAPIFADCAPFSLMQELAPTVFDSSFQKKLQEREYSTAKEDLLQKIESAKETEKASLKVVLATLYMRDQKEEEAFEIYLEALSAIPRKSLQEGEVSKDLKMSQDEYTLYNKSLVQYLEQSKGPPLEVVKELEKTLTPVIKTHPEYVQVRFLLAATQANQRQYEEFFYHFFCAFRQNQECFLAYKTLGILNIKLFERARDEESKSARRAEVQKFLQLAIKENAHDVALYKLLVVFATPESKKEVVTQVLELIVQNDVQIPRSDIPFYVNEACLVDKKEVAKSFLNKQATYYQYSRIIEDMRKVITDDKDGNS